MSNWPEDDWFRDNPPRTAGPVASGDATVQLPNRSPAPGQPGQPGRPAGGPGGSGRPGGSRAAWPEQPALRTPGSPGRSPRPGRPGGPGPSGRPGGAGGPGRPGGPGGYSGGPSTPLWRRLLRPRPIIAALVVLVCLALVGSVASYFYFDSQLVKKNVLTSYAGRPAPGAGQNWLITGSDSRQGLSRKEERKLATGHDVSGQRSDTILILHLPANGGRPVLISLPRDSYVPIPGHGYNKINAAYSFGGPALLAKTVQDVTGLYINHYMGIGFGGFVRVVDAVGGVRLCLKVAIDDPASGLHLKKGCQTLDGAQALGYVRTRHEFATQDLQREQDQRIFLKALLTKLTSPSVLFNPFKSLPAASNVVGSLTVDSGTSLYQLVKVAFALRHPITTTVPIANANLSTPAGDAVQWDRTQALKLFRELRLDEPVSKDLITGSRQS